MMKTNNDFVLKTLHVIAWIIFIGLCIEAGALIFNFIFSLFKPIAAHSLYKGLNLFELYQNHFTHFVGEMSFIIVLAILKAYLFYLVVKIFKILNFVKPFTIEVAELIEKISYDAFVISIISIIAHQYTNENIKSGLKVSSIESYWNDTSAFLMMAAILYIISHLFKKGLELQNESDLTI